MAEQTWGNYTVNLRQQGYGGSGLVYFGYDLINKREIAVKKMPDIARSLREAWIMQSYGKDKRYTEFYDFFIHDNHGCIVMEKINGNLLKQYDLRGSIKITINILNALENLHSKGILHTDISPRNIMLTNQETWEIKLIDFGRAVWKDSHGVFRGKAKGWMTPFANEISNDYDLYATAAVCLYMVTGDTDLSLLSDPALKSILKKAMHKSPSSRYQTADAFREDIQNYLSSLESKSPEFQSDGSNADKLMIVAHPDDEILFGGGELLKEKGWKVICVTNGANIKRAEEFKSIMESVGAEYEIWDFPDVWEGDFDRPALTKKLKKALNNKNYKKIVTHNPTGEYGHSQHIALSEIVHSLCKKNLFVFGYGDKKIPNEILKEKLRLLHQYELFVFQKDYYMNLKEIEYEQIRKAAYGEKKQ